MFWNLCFGIYASAFYEILTARPGATFHSVPIVVSIYPDLELHNAFMANQVWARDKIHPDLLRSYRAATIITMES